MEWVRSHRIAPVSAEGMKLQKLEHLAQRLSWLPPRSVCVCVCVRVCTWPRDSAGSHLGECVCVCVHLAQRLSWFPPRSVCVCVCVHLAQRAGSHLGVSVCVCVCVCALGPETQLAPT